MKPSRKRKSSKLRSILKTWRGSGSIGTTDTPQIIDETLEIVSDPRMMEMIEQSQKEVQRGDVHPLRDLLKKQ